MNYGKLRDVLQDYIILLSEQVYDYHTETKLTNARELLEMAEDVMYEQLNSASN